MASKKEERIAAAKKTANAAMNREAAKYKKNKTKFGSERQRRTALLKAGRGAAKAKHGVTLGRAKGEG